VNVTHVGPALTIGPLARGAFLLAVSALALAAIALQFAQVRALYGGEGAHAERINCPSCGARVPADGAVCEYCGEPLEEGVEE
jgi:rRNA maturation endonuclease Nob1